MAQRRAYLPSGLGSSQWQAEFPPGGSLISWPGMATAASCLGGPTMPTRQGQGQGAREGQESLCKDAGAQEQGTCSPC